MEPTINSSAPAAAFESKDDPGNTAEAIVESSPSDYSKQITPAGSSQVATQRAANGNMWPVNFATSPPSEPLTSNKTSLRKSKVDDFERVQESIKTLALENNPDSQLPIKEKAASKRQDTKRKTKNKPRRSAWVTTKIPKGPSKRRQKEPSSARSSTSDGGWDRGVTEFRSGHLDGWEGGLGPSLMQWTFLREMPSLETPEHVEAWLDATEKELRDVTREVRMSDYHRYMLTPEETRDASSFDAEYWARNIVPAYWLPLKVGKQSLNLFWRELKLSDEPEPVDEGDIGTPWWIEFPPHHSAFLQVFQHPEVAGFDPDETVEEREARARDKGSGEATRLILEKRHEKSRKRHKYPRHDTANARSTSQARMRFKPSLKLVIRTANRSDMQPLSELFNRYITFSIATTEEETLTEEDMKERWKAFQAQGLPMLVACEPSYTRRNARNHRCNDDFFIPEKVIGFAFATDPNDSDGTSSQHTKLVNVFTSRDYYMKGIGTCLFDKMIKTLQPAHEEITACEADIPPLRQDKAGQAVDVKTIRVHFLWDQAQPERLEWISAWLRNKFGFQQRGTLHGVSSKLGREVNQTVFHKTFN